MIYTVTFNPALDYIMKLDTLESRDINRSADEEISYGGKGINVSVILNELGEDTTALGFLAGFTGEELEKRLSNDGVNCDFIYLKNGHTRINVKIKADNEYDINASGPSITDEDVDRLIDKLKQINDDDTLVLAGSIPSSLSSDIYERMLESLKDKKINIVVDATGDLLKNVLKYKPFLIKPNHHELGELFGVSINTLDDVELYAKRLQQMGARNVLVSRGKEGAALLDENGNLHTIGNVPGRIKSSVGCGDSMVAGFIAGYIQKHDYYYALRLGSACGNATAFTYTLATRHDIDEMMENEYLK